MFFIEQSQIYYFFLYICLGYNFFYESRTNNIIMQIGILGSGSWATALVKIACEKNEIVHWFVRSDENRDFINKRGHNPKYLSGVSFDKNKLKLYTDINLFAKNIDCLILATPSPYISSVLEPLTVSLENKFIYIATKGIVSETYQLITEYFKEKYKVSNNQLGAIGGPCHAEEVAMERLSYLTFASEDSESRDKIIEKMSCSYIKIKSSEDVLGVEIGAVLKNIYALTVGVAHGLGNGDNYIAILVSNAAREMKQIVATLYKESDRNICDSVYLGDLLVTAYSVFSRNRMFGNMIGKGYSVSAAQMEMNMIAEGYYATKCIYEFLSISKHKFEIPIIDTIYDILYKKTKPALAFNKLSNVLV